MSAERETHAGGTHRDVARRLVADIAARRPDLLEHDGIDLSPTIEQALFGRLRRPRRDPPLSGPRSVLRLCRHGVRALLPRQPPAAGDVVALVVNPAQDRILDPVRRGLAERGVRTFTVYESHARSVRGAADRSGRLVDQLRPTRALRLLAFELRARSGLAAATAGFEDVVDQPTATRMRSALAEAIGQAALYATCTDALAETRPALLVGFNEIGRWSRILPAVGRRRGIPTLDVAHAEAVDVEAIEGASYDRYAVFGPRAARVLERAGIEPTAIVQVGAPRFDTLIARHHHTASPPAGRRIVFASQWLTGAMTADVKRRTVEAAITAAAAAAPCELVIQRHPIERDEIAAEVAATVAAPGVTVRHGQPRDLYEALDGAWLLVTGWSNTVFEAVLSNVPALCINATDRPLQMPLVEEGIALGATDGPSAAEAVRTLLSPSAWLEAVERARPALVDHLGPLDGRATERLVELVKDLSLSDRPPPPTPERA